MLCNRPTSGARRKLSSPNLDDAREVVATGLKAPKGMKIAFYPVDAVKSSPGGTDNEIQFH